MGLQPEDEDLRQRADGRDQPSQRKHDPGNEVKSYENIIKHVHENCSPQFNIQTHRSKRGWCPPGSSRVGPVSTGEIKMCHYVQLSIIIRVVWFRDFFFQQCIFSLNMTLTCGQEDRWSLRAGPVRSLSTQIRTRRSQGSWQSYWFESDRQALEEVSCEIMHFSIIYWIIQDD